MNPEPRVGHELAAQHGLTRDEYEKIISVLGRPPTYTELGIYSVMWSEHCSYKNSLTEIKKLPRKGDRLLAEAGEENAGLVDLGDDLAVAFKIESHNHPSAVEPYQGAATGVGGILRDVFTMGARPIALLNSLRFGDLDDDRTRYLLMHVVRGIADYGNSFGVPTVGGEVYFDRSYSSNPIVNVMAVGILDKRRIVRAVANGIGNPVFIVGSATGRDGIHGATFASEEISDKSEERRPAVQVGDPFTEKCLLEALMEALDSNCLVSVQDMGAAGLACSTSEMSARGGSGMEINLDLVPVRESNMTPYEIVLSESQERMLVITSPEKKSALKRIFEKWEINAVEIGKIVEEGRVCFKSGDRIFASIPAPSLVAGYGAPIYSREKRTPDYTASGSGFMEDIVPAASDMEEALISLLSSPNISSKEWIYQQYDSAVQTNTVQPPGSDAAVVRLKGTRRLLAVTTDGNSRYVYLSPRRGGSIAVAEAARNIVCTGGKPIAITNCLNFGNPYDPVVYWQFSEAVTGIGEACDALSTPVTGGNVSFYNEGPAGSVLPTPVIGMIGIIESEQHIVTPDFKDEGDVIIVLGESRGDVGGSEYLSRTYGLTNGQAPFIDLPLERQVQSCALELIRSGLVKSAHDVSEGGVATALAECSIHNKTNPRGADVNLSKDTRSDFLLFGEDQSRIIISVHPAQLKLVETLIINTNIPYQILGAVAGKRLRINRIIDLSLQDISESYQFSLQKSLRDRI